MTNPPRDGIITANGLSADFRFISGSTVDINRSQIETAAGKVWVYDHELTYDPPKDLSPEAAAVVAKERVQDGDIDPKECNGD